MSFYCRNSFVLFEAAFHNGLDVFGNLETVDQTIPGVIHEWGNIKEELTIKFAKHDHVMIEELMRKGIALFFMKYFIGATIGLFIL